MPASAPPRSSNSAEKAVSVLTLFTADRPIWSPDRAAKHLHVSVATGYRYFSVLVACGLLEKLQRNQYVLGPAVVELDRQVRAADPVLRLAQPAMARLLRKIREPAAVLLCRHYRQTVMCIHQETNSGVEQVSSYERGARRPMFRGATSKVILAHLPPRAIADLWRDHRREIVAAGFGGGFEDFKTALREIRQSGVWVSTGEVDPGRTGIAAPVFDADGRVTGSLSVVLLKPHPPQRVVARLRALVVACAREIETLRDGAGLPHKTASKQKACAS